MRANNINPSSSICFYRNLNFRFATTKVRAKQETCYEKFKACEDMPYKDMLCLQLLSSMDPTNIVNGCSS
jgi:hypothetical protein